MRATRGVKRNIAVRRSTTQTVTDSTTLVSDDSLIVKVASGGKYTFRLVYFVSCNNVSTSGFKFGLNGGTATMTSFRAAFLAHNTSGSGATAVLNISDSTSTSLSTTHGITACGAINKVVIEGSFTVNAGGTFIPQFAQNAETGASESVAVLSGSYLELTRIP